MGDYNRKPIDDLPYGLKGQHHKDPKCLKWYTGTHPTLGIECVIQEYEDGYVIYRDPKTQAFLPGCKTWGNKKGKRGRSIVDIIDEIADKDTWIAMLLRHFMLTNSKDEEVSLRAMNQLLDRYFGKPTQNQSIEVGSKNGEAIKSKLNDMFGINDNPVPLSDGDNATDSTDPSENNEPDNQSGAD